MSPYEKIDFESIKSKKLNLLEFTKLKPEDFGATSDTVIVLLLGLYTLLLISDQRSKCRLHEL